MPFFFLIGDTLIKPPLSRFPQFYEGRKETLTRIECHELFSQHFIVEEKLDGSITIEEKELKWHDGKVYLCLEDMKFVHSVFYDSLPARYILIDVLNEDGSRFPYLSRKRVSKELGYPMPFLLMEGLKVHRVMVDAFLDFLTKPFKSWFGNETAEGIVVKSEGDLFLGGKYSNLDLKGKSRFDKTKTNHILGFKYPL